MLNTMNSYLIFTVILLKISFGIGSYIDFLQDFVEYQGSRFSVTEFSCNKHESVQLFKVLSQSKHRFSYINPNLVSRMQYPIPANSHIFVLNLECSEALKVLIEADEKKYFKFPFSWITIFNSTKLPLHDAKSLFADINILADSDVNFVELISERDEAFVRKIYKKSNFTDDMIIEAMGTWTRQNKFLPFRNFEKVAAKRRKNMSLTLKGTLVITQNDTYQHLTDKRNRHHDIVTKINYVVMRELKDIYNFTYDYSYEKLWGYKTPTGQWIGMVGKLIRKEIDFGGSTLFITKDRIDLIDYIGMTTPTRSAAIFRSPKLSYVTNIYTLPFDIKVWIATILLSALGAIALYLTLKWEWKKKDYVETPETIADNHKLNDSFVDVALLSFAALCQQGASALPISVPGRITAIFLYLSLMFLFTSYSASIVALLQLPSDSIKTLKNLLESRLQVGVNDNSFSRYYFAKMDEPVSRAIYLQKIAPPGQKDNFMTMDAGIARMRQGLFAFHIELGVGYKIISETFREDEKCGLQEIVFLRVVDPWVAIQKNSTYKEMMKLGLRLMQETGLQKREYNLIYTKRPVCTTKGSNFITVGLVDCYPLLIIIAFGVAFALAILFLEIYVHSRFDRFKDKLAHRNCIKIFQKK